MNQSQRIQSPSSGYNTNEAARGSSVPSRRPGQVGGTINKVHPAVKEAPSKILHPPRRSSFARGQFMPAWPLGGREGKAYLDAEKRVCGKVTVRLSFRKKPSSQSLKHREIKVSLRVSQKQ